MNDVFPRKITLAEDSDNPIFDIRKAQGGAPNNYGYEVRLKDGAALSSHKDFVLRFLANQYLENESATYLTGYALRVPSTNGCTGPSTAVWHMGQLQIGMMQWR